MFSQSKVLLIQETCIKLELKGTEKVLIRCAYSKVLGLYLGFSHPVPQLHRHKAYPLAPFARYDLTIPANVIATVATDHLT